MPATADESGITSHECQVLLDLLEGEQPRHTAEIGCAHGVSTQAIAKALERNDKGHHFAVDPVQHTYWNDAGKQRLSASNLSHRVTFHDDYPERVFHTLPNLDFVLIDGTHLFDLTILDFVVSDRALKVGGIIGFHDKNMPAVRSALRFILANRSYEPFSIGRANPRVTRWQKFRMRAALQVGRLIAGGRELISKRFPFDSLGFDANTNLVFIRKTGADKRDWRYFHDF